MTGPARRLLVPAITTALMLLVLLGLGTWQVERLQWKLAILGRIAQAEAAPPVPLAGTPADLTPADFTPADFTKVSATGSFRPGLIAYYGSEGGKTPQGDMLGAQQLALLDRPGAPPLLVNRGWVPLPPRPQDAPPPGPATVTGYVRPPDAPGMFSAPDDAAAHRFYTLAPRPIARALGWPAPAAFSLIALGDTPPGGAPDPAHHLPRPPNNHLSYALTWYGLAASLLVIFTLHARKVLRS